MVERNSCAKGMPVLKTSPHRTMDVRQEKANLSYLFVLSARSEENQDSCVPAVQQVLQIPLILALKYHDIGFLC